MPRCTLYLLAIIFLVATAAAGEIPTGESIESLRKNYTALAAEGKHEEALQYAEAWVAAARKSQRTSQLAEALVRQGQSQFALDRFDAARSTFLEARELLQVYPDSRLEGSVLLGLAEVDLREGNYSNAGEWLDGVEQLWRSTEAPSLGARLWTARAGIAFRQRRTGEALQHRLRAVKQARFADDSALLFQALTNLARAYLDVHDYSAAIPLFMETAELDGRPLDRVVNLIQLGISQFELNQFDAARESFSSAREMAVQLGSPRLEGTAIGELGLVVWNQRRAAEEAEAYFEEAIEKMTAIGDRVNAVVWRTNKALVLRETDRFEEALSLYRELETELEAIEGQEVWPTIYKGMGQCLLGLGRLDDARRTIDQCLVAARRGGDSERIWECEQLRGRLIARAGDINAAREAYEAALAEIERVRVSLLVGRFKADFFEDKLEVFQEYAALLADRLPDEAAARATFEISERARARAFLDEFAHSYDSNRGAVSEELLQREEALLEQIRNLRAASASGGSNAAEIARLESELDGLSVTARRQLEMPAYNTRPSALYEIQASLELEERMLVYWLAKPASHLWLIDRDGIERHELPATGRLESLVRDAYAELIDPGSTPELTPLAGALLEPLLQRGLTDGSLLIVPSGILHYFPFEALPVSKDVVLSDRAATTYLPSASTLVHLRETVMHDRPPALLAVGGVPYERSGEGPHLAGKGGFGALPFSGPEVRAVHDRFGRRAANLLIGDAVKESSVKAMPLGKYSVLHFATHGRIDAASHSASGLVLPPGEDSEDGLLQAREIRALGLNAELVVLSACQSALGRLVTGEGMVGLTRAFLDAGARSVVASLWNVNDQASADFMDVFYASLAEGASRADALRAARVKLRARPEYAHPYYWAAWVLNGEGRGEIKFPVRWERWALLGLGLLLIGVLLGWRRVQSRS